MDQDFSTQQRMKVGVVGLGRMGAPIAQALRDAHPVSVYDVHGERIREAGFDDARVSSLEELAGACDVLVTVLPGVEELTSVMRSALPVLPSGALWIDLTSGDPRTTRVLGADAHRYGIDVVTAPMGGSVPEAIAGELVFFVSGTDAAIERATPVLGLLAADDGIRWCGRRAEDGQIVKLLANALWFAHALAGSEAMLVGSALGLPTEHLHRLLRGSAGGSRFLDRDLDRLLDGNYLKTFAIDRVAEELDTVAAIGAVAGVAMPVLDASAALHRDASDRFGPALGELLGARLIEEQSGRQLRR